MSLKMKVHAFDGSARKFVGSVFCSDISLSLGFFPATGLAEEFAKLLRNIVL